MLIEDEQIDQSCWLPAGTSLITEERAAKPDCQVIRDGDHILYAQLQVRNLMNWLHERRRISDQHLHDGQTYERWRLAFQSALEGRRIDFGQGGAAPVAGLSEMGYKRILMRMPVHHRKRLEQSLEVASSTHIFIANRDSVYFRRAFENLSHLIEPIREELATYAKSILDGTLKPV